MKVTRNKGLAKRVVSGLVVFAFAAAFMAAAGPSSRVEAKNDGSSLKGWKTDETGKMLLSTEEVCSVELKGGKMTTYLEDEQVP